MAILEKLETLKKEDLITQDQVIRLRTNLSTNRLSVIIFVEILCKISSEFLSMKKEIKSLKTALKKLEN